MSYSNYATGVLKGTAGQSGSQYNFLVTGLSDYTGASGVMIKNDITQSAVGNPGTRIYQDSNDNSWIDYRTNATDGAKALSVRLQDDSNPSSFSNMLVLNKDTMTNTAVFGATFGGRVSASQYYVGQTDTRAPTAAGVYIGMDQNTAGVFRVNKGSGTGGYTFSTYNADGSLYKNNLNLNASGTIQAPYYQSSGNTQDSETTAVASFDQTGNMVRDYSYNTRFRSLEARMMSVEGQSGTSFPTKMNEVIGRLNSLKVWSTDIQTLAVSLTPTTAPPQPTETLITASMPTSPVAQYNYYSFGIYNNVGYSQIGGGLFSFSLTNPTAVTQVGNSLMWYSTSTYGINNNNGSGGTLLFPSNAVNGLNYPGYGLVSGNSILLLNVTAGTENNGYGGFNGGGQAYGLAANGNTVYIATSTGVQTGLMVSPYTITTIVSGLPAYSASRITLDGTYFYICDQGVTNNINQYSMANNTLVQTIATSPSVITWMRAQNGYVYYSMTQYLYRVNTTTKVAQQLASHSGTVIPMFDFDSTGNLYYIALPTTGNQYNPALYKISNL